MARTVLFPETDVGYLIQAGVTNNAYQWASADGTAGGIAPAVPFGGYFSCNADSQLSNFIKLVGNNPGIPSVITYNVSVIFSVETATLGGITRLPVDVITPSVSNTSVFGNRLMMNILGVTGSTTVFQGEATFIHNDANASSSSDPTAYQFTIAQDTPVLNGIIQFDITVSGTFGTNTSGVDLGVWAGLL